MTWTTRTKPTTTWGDRSAYLLNEDGGFLLWEDGTKIVISEIAYSEHATYTKRSTITTNWTING